MTKRIISLCVSLLVLLSVFSGCGNGTSSEPTATPQSSSESTAQQSGDSSTAVAADPLGKYETPVDITTVLSYGPSSNAKLIPKDTTPENQSYIKMCAETLGINLKFLWAVPTDQAEQKTNLMFASGDFPDVMNVTMQQFQQLKDADAIADMTDAFDKYTLPEIKNDLVKDGEAGLKAVSKDGKLMGIPMLSNPTGAIDLLWLRYDWIKNLGMQEPKTMQDVLKLAEAFAAKDPDQNGKNDTVGLGFTKDLFSVGTLGGFFNSFRAYPNGWIKGQDGSLVYGNIQPEMKTAIAKLQEMYKNGWVDKEFAIKDDNKLVEDITAGKVGMIYGAWWNSAWPIQFNVTKDPKAEWKCYPIMSNDDKPALPAMRRTIIDGVVVANKNCKNPEAAIKLLNLYYDINYKSGETKYGDAMKPENGYVWDWIPFRIAPYWGTYDQFKVLKEVKDSKDESKLSTAGMKLDYDYAMKYYHGGEREWWGYYYSRAAEDGPWAVIGSLLDNNQVKYREYYGTPTPTEAERAATLDKDFMQTCTKIIMGESLDAFDKYVDNFNANGGKDWTKEVNEQYNEINK